MNRREAPRGDLDSRGGHDLASYVLVADEDGRRAALCVFESARTLRCPAIIARDGHDAIDILNRFGPPRLLIVDLSLPGTSGFEVIEAVRRKEGGPTKIIAWSANRTLREFALHRQDPGDMKVLRSWARPAVLRGAIKWARGGPEEEATEDASGASDDLQERMSAFAEHARQACGAAGVAVYMATGQTLPNGEPELRALVTWGADAPMPASPDLLPRVSELVIESGDIVHWPDLQELADTLPENREEVRGIVAVPIIAADNRTVGAILLFDTRPLVLREEDVDALERLGRSDLAVEVTCGGLADCARRPSRGDESAVEKPAPRRADVPAAAGRALPDRAIADFELAREFARARREHTSLTVILFHIAARFDERTPDRSAPGEQMARVTEALAVVSRGSDLTIRWDDERLVVVVTGVSEEVARSIAERLRAAMLGGAGPGLAISGSVTEMAPGESIDGVVNRADRKVRLAQAGGRNRIV